MSWIRQLSLRIATRSAHHFKHGAVVVRGGKVLSLATNGRFHAEVSALRGVDCECDLYVTRYFRGKASLSKPCPLCMVHLRKSKVQRVFYSVDAENWAVLHRKDF